MQREDYRAGDSALERSGSDERALTSIVGDLWDKTELLMRQELALVSSELDRKIERVKTDLTTASISAATLFLGAAALVAALIGLLARWLPMWLSGGIVGFVLIGVGYVLLHRSTTDLARMDMAPRATERSLERTAYQMKEAVR